MMRAWPAIIVFVVLPVKSMAIDVTKFEYRDLKLGINIEEVISIFPGEPREERKFKRNIVKGYTHYFSTGKFPQEDLDYFQFTFNMDKKLAKIWNKQQYRNILNISDIGMRFFEKYGKATYCLPDEEEFNCKWEGEYCDTHFKNLKLPCQSMSVRIFYGGNSGLYDKPRWTEVIVSLTDLQAITENEKHVFRNCSTRSEQRLTVDGGFDGLEGREALSPAGVEG